MTTLGTWNIPTRTRHGRLWTVDISKFAGKSMPLRFTTVEDTTLRTDFLTDTLGFTTS